MNDKTADQFTERIKQVLEDFENFEGDDDSDDSHTRALTVAFYPSFYYDAQEE